MPLSDEEALKILGAPTGPITVSSPRAIADDQQALEILSGRPYQETTPEERKRAQGLEGQSVRDTLSMNLGDAYDRRRLMAADIYERYAKDEQGLISTMTQMVGKVGVGGFYDLFGEAIVAGGKSLVAALPDDIEDPLKKSVAQAGLAFMETDMAQAGVEALATGAEMYGEWKDKNPVHAATLEAIVNIGLLLAPSPKSKPKFGTPRKPGGVEGALRSSAAASRTKAKRKAAENIVKPRMTKKQYADDLVRQSRTREQGLIRHRVERISAKQDDAVSELMKIDIQPRRSLQKNDQIIAKAVNREADKLVKRLDRITRKATDAELNNLHAVARTYARKSPALRGEAVKSMERLEPVVRTAIRKHGSGPGGLLRARRELDRWIGDWGAGKTLSQDTQSALKVAVDGYRKALNGTVDTLAPGFGVNKSLAKQSRLLGVRDTLSLRIAHENRNAVSRLYAKTMGVVTARTQLVGITAAALGVTYMTASGMVAPFMLSGGIFALGAGAARVVLSPRTRMAMAKLIQLSKSTARLADQTHLDRVYLQQFLDEAAER